MAKAASLTDRLTKIAVEKKKAEKEPQRMAEERVNFNTRLPEDLIIDMKVYCAKNKIKIQDFIGDVLKEALEARK